MLLCFLLDGTLPESLPNKDARKNFRNSAKAYFENEETFLRKEGRRKEVVNR